MLEIWRLGPARTSLSNISLWKSAGKCSAKNAVGHRSAASTASSDNIPTTGNRSCCGNIAPNHCSSALRASSIASSVGFKLVFSACRTAADFNKRRMIWLWCILSTKCSARK